MTFPSSSWQKGSGGAPDNCKSEFLKQYYKRTEGEHLGSFYENMDSTRRTSEEQRRRRYSSLSSSVRFGSRATPTPEGGRSRRRSSSRHGHARSMGSTRSGSKRASTAVSAVSGPRLSLLSSTSEPVLVAASLHKYGRRSLLKDDFSPALHTAPRPHSRDESSIVLRSSMPQHGLRHGRLGPICNPRLRSSNELQFEPIEFKHSDPELLYMHRRGAAGPYELTNYVRQAIRKQVDLASTGH